MHKILSKAFNSSNENVGEENKFYIMLMKEYNVADPRLYLTHNSPSIPPVSLKFHYYNVVGRQVFSIICFLEYSREHGNNAINLDSIMNKLTSTSFLSKSFDFVKETFQLSNFEIITSYSLLISGDKFSDQLKANSYLALLGILYMSNIELRIEEFILKIDKFLLK